MVKHPELSQRDKNIQAKVTSLFGKWNEEKVQIFVLKCREEKSKAVRNINTQVKFRYLKNLLKYRIKVLVLCYFPPAVKGFHSVCSSVFPLTTAHVEL